ncbi:hypothetical protein A2U01_0056439, partial [Trifolium medium]|nr:hypothetical protein [Trifolium medium]
MLELKWSMKEECIYNITMTSPKDQKQLKDDVKELGLGNSPSSIILKDDH